jgi:tellurium resistance protein TerD
MRYIKCCLSGKPRLSVLHQASLHQRLQSAGAKNPGSPEKQRHGMAMLGLGQEQPFSLQKDQVFELTKSLETVRVGLGWKKRSTSGPDFDLDASAIPLKDGGSYYGGLWFVYFGNQESPGGLIKSMGDDLVGGSGASDDDDETIVIQLSKLPPDMTRIILPISMYEAEERRQNFGQVGKAHCRIIDDRTGQEKVRYDLAESFSSETAVVFAELFHERGIWKFRALGEGFTGNLAAVCHKYGVNVA